MKTNSLDKLYRFDKYGICSFRSLIDKNVFIKAEIGSVSSVRYNRTKYNRMNGAEQLEYEKKLNKLVSEYRLYYTDTVFTVVTKEVYRYFTEKQDKGIYCSEAELKHLFGL